MVPILSFRSQSLLTTILPLLLFFFFYSAITPAHGFSVPRTKIAEQIVQQQLEAFQKCNLAEAFAYNSESNQAVTGPWQSFATSLADPAFRPIMGHAESCVLMTINHDDEYTCCLVKIVPGKDPLPDRLQKVIDETRRSEGLDSEDEDDDDDNDEEDEEEEGRKSLPPCLLYWWEVSKQYDDEDQDDNNFYYLVDSILPDAEDLEMDYMETTLFVVDDELEEGEEDDDDDDLSGFFFDLGLL